MIYLFDKLITHKILRYHAQCLRLENKLQLPDAHDGSGCTEYFCCIFLKSREMTNVSPTKWYGSNAAVQSSRNTKQPLNKLQQTYNFNRILHFSRLFALHAWPHLKPQDYDVEAKFPFSLRVLLSLYFARLGRRPKSKSIVYLFWSALTTFSLACFFVVKLLVFESAKLRNVVLRTGLSLESKFLRNMSTDILEERSLKFAFSWLPKNKAAKKIITPQQN